MVGFGPPQAISAAAKLVAEVRATTRSTPRRRRGPTRRYRRLREWAEAGAFFPYARAVASSISDESSWIGESRSAG